MADQENLTDEQKRELALKAFGKKPEDTPAKTDEEIANEKKIEEDRIAAELKKKEEDELAAKNAKPTPEAVKVLPTDEELLEMASQKAGRKITSWDDLKLSPTEADKKKLEEDRDSEKLTYGLKKGLFNKKQYESFISDSKSPKDLVYARELEMAKADDPDWTDDKQAEFQEEFDEKFGLKLDPTSSKYKRGQKNILAIADNILKAEYSPIFNLDAEYGKYENEVNSRKAQEQKILAAAPVYKEDVTKILSEFSKVEMDFGGEKFDIPVSQEIIDSVSEVMLDNNFSSSQILSGYKKEGLAEFVRQYIIGQNYQTIAFEAAKQYRAKHEKGVRGIPEGGKLQKPEEGDDGLTDKQKEALSYFRGKEKPVIAN